MKPQVLIQSTWASASRMYRPTVSREQESGHLLHDVMDRFFSGSARALVSQLLDSEDVDSEEIKAIRKEVNRRLKD